jgi:hypothetical protein
MTRLYIPVAVAVVLIVSMTFWESVYSDRFTGSSVSPEQFHQKFASLPMKVGSWVGADRPVPEETLKTAGAVSHISRVYKNEETGEEVDLWLIVGHARDISRHTPDVCYPSQGFAMDGTQLQQRIKAEGTGKEGEFHTARFRKEAALGAGGPLVRVFWAWNPNTDEQKDWVAPDATRLAFGNNTALYKMYFTAPMKERDESVTDNVAYKFAQIMLPEVNKTLFAAPGATPLDAPAEGAEGAAAPADATAAPAAEAPATEPAA